MLDDKAINDNGVNDNYKLDNEDDNGNRLKGACSKIIGK